MRALLFIAFAVATSFTVQAASPPNIVFIMADDLGWADVGFHGGNAPTPHLDQLAHENLELTHHYVAPVCSPTRTGLMTGRFWSRFGVTTPQNERAMQWDTVTLPRALKSVGYDTCLTGKWHLGSKPEWGPNHFGFDHSYGSLGGGVGPWNHRYKEGPFSITWHRDEKLIEEQGHVTDLITNEAIQWLAARTDKPFFLYVPFTAVHLPVKEPEAWFNRVPSSIIGDVARHYAASIMHLDDSVGKLVAAIDKSGKAANTIIVFTSDNGGSDAENNGQSYPSDGYPTGRLTGNNKPLRGKKADVYEGGIRVPAIVRWPGTLKAGTCDAPMHIADWMPTFSALAGFVPDHDLKWDGKNMWPVIAGTEQATPRALYWVGPSFRQRALRDGDWKLVSVKKDKLELFNLADDPNETMDLAKKMPEKVAALRAKMDDVARADHDAEAKD